MCQSGPICMCPKKHQTKTIPKKKTSLFSKLTLILYYLIISEYNTLTYEQMDIKSYCESCGMKMEIVFLLWPCDVFTLNEYERRKKNHELCSLKCQKCGHVLAAHKFKQLFSYNSSLFYIV